MHLVCMVRKQSEYIRDEFGDRELTIKERMRRLSKPNKPVRLSEVVKIELLKIKKEKDLKSIDAVLKKLLKRQAKGDY